MDTELVRAAFILSFAVSNKKGICDLLSYATESPCGAYIAPPRSGARHWLPPKARCANFFMNSSRVISANPATISSL